MTHPIALPPTRSPEPPLRPLPEGACDAHIHMVGDDYALWDGRVEDPAPGSMADWLAQCRDQMQKLGFARTVIVHSILYGADNSITLDAVRALGPDVARAVCLVRDDVNDKTLDTLAAANTCAVRLNYVHGGILSWDGARAMAPRLAARDMHIQMLLHTHQHMMELADDVRALPVPLVIDHVGWPDLSLGVDDPGFQCLLRLVAEGHVYVKLSALYRLCPAPFDRAAPFVEALLRANPERCLWGSDWPHLMLADAALPDAGDLLNQFLSLADTNQTQHVLVNNPNTLFQFT